MTGGLWPALVSDRFVDVSVASRIKRETNQIVGCANIFLRRPPILGYHDRPKMVFSLFVHWIQSSLDVWLAILDGTCRNLICGKSTISRTQIGCIPPIPVAPARRWVQSAQTDIPENKFSFGSEDIWMK
jgi:hypothetical protein